MSIKSKELIANTLIELMKDNPFNVITISEICGNASLVRKTFYNNFSSKEDVIEYITEKLVAEYLQMIRDKKDFSPKEMSYLYFYFAKTNSSIMSMFIDNNLFYIFRNQLNRILPTINILVPDSKLNSLSADNLEYVFAFHSAGVIHLLELWIKTGFKKTAREMSDIYYAITQGV